MANEISLIVNFSAAKSGAATSIYYSASLAMAGEDLSNQTQTVGITQASLLIGSVAGSGLICVKNLMAQTLDANLLWTDVNTIYIGATGVTNASNAYMIVRAGESVVFRKSTAALFVIAGTVNTLIQIVAVEP